MIDTNIESNAATAAPDTTPRRPRLDDPAVLLAAVTASWPKISDWLVNEGESPDDVSADRERTAQGIVDAIENAESGFAACRTLDRNGWSPDDDLVAIMGDVLHARFAALEVVETAWAVTAELKPAHSVGDKIRFRQYPGRFDRTTCEGTVTEVCTARARYLVFCPELGHVPAGTMRSGSTGRYVNFEDVVP